MTRINGFNLGVYAFLLTIALSIVLGATAYAGKQQLTAFVIGVPTITLLVFLVLAEVTPRLVKLTGAFGVSEDDAPQAAEDDAGASPGGMETGSWRRIGIVYGWLLLYFAMTLVFGFYIAIPVFMVLFLTIESRLIPVFAVGVMVAAGLPLYIIFRLVLDIPPWPGILPRIIPGVIGGGIVPSELGRSTRQQARSSALATVAPACCSARR